MHKSPSRELKSNLRYDYTYIHPYHYYTHNLYCTSYIPYPTTNGAHTGYGRSRRNFSIRTGGANREIRESRDGMGGRPLSISVTFHLISFTTPCLSSPHITSLVTVYSSSFLHCKTLYCTVLYTVPVLFCFYVVECHGYIYHIRSYIMVTSIRG